MSKKEIGDRPVGKVSGLMKPLFLHIVLRSFRPPKVFPLPTPLCSRAEDIQASMHEDDDDYHVADYNHGDASDC